MGNTQSAEAPRKPPTKLTKPRTNTSTSNLLAISSAPSRRNSTLSLPVAPNKRSSTVSLAEVTTDGEDTALKSRTGSRTKRRSLFRSKSAQPESTTPIDEPSSDIDTKMNSNPLHRYSSMVSVRVDMVGEVHNAVSNSRPPVRTTRSAQTYFPQASQPARLSLVIEAQSPEPDPQEELKQLGLRHGSFDNGVQASPISPIERSNSPDLIPIPIRRRSLLTPGIATRKTSREKIIRKSLPAQPSTGNMGSRSDSEKRNFRKTLPVQATQSQDELRQYYHDPFKPTSSSLEDLAALEYKRFSDLQPRTVTPSDLDYGHIGAYKLGSLRITNGTVSPAPSGPDTSYFDTKIQKHTNVDEDDQIDSTLPPRDEEPSEPSEKLYNKRTGTFVEAQQSHVRFEFHEVSDVPPKIVETMVEIPTFSLGLSEFQTNLSPRQSIVVQSPSTAYEMAQAYMQEIAASPFSFEESPPPSPQLEATSKPTEIEDNLFDDEPGSAISLAPPASQQPVLQYSQRSIETQTSFGSLVAPVVKAGSSQQSLQKLLQGPREHPPKPLEKADSGYSSKTSLRSLRSRRSFTESEPFTEPPKLSTLAPVAPAVPNKSPPPTPPKNLYTKYSDDRSIGSSTVQGSKSPDTEYAPATPAKDWSSRSSYGLGEAIVSSQTPHQPETSQNDALRQAPYRQAPPVPQKPPTSTWSGWTGPPPLPIKSIEQTQAMAKMSSETLPAPERPTPKRRESTPLLPYGKTMRPGLKPSASDTSISTTSRRLQKRGSVAQPGVIVQGFTEIEPASVPPVSQEVSEHLEERLKNFPALTHTYKSVQRTNSKETLATIFSMASAEQQAEENQRMSRFQGLTPDAPSNADIEQSMKAESARSPAPGQRFSLMPKILRRSAERENRRQSLENMSRNRSSPREAEGQEIYIADLGALSASLGSSPYALATVALAPISGNRTHESPSATKQEWNVVRGRTVGMDSKSAAQYARERSRSRENERRRSLRRQSYESRNSSEERLYLPYDLRSKFATEAGPPVPNISQGQTEGYSLPRKTKSPPPVSMKMPRKRMSSPPPKPSRAPPNAPAEVPRIPEVDQPQSHAHVENQRQAPVWQNQENLWHNRKQSAREALSNARQSINSTRPGNRRPSLERQNQWSSKPLEKRPSFEQHHYPRQPVQQSHSCSSFKDQRRGFASQSYNSPQPRPDPRAFARASFDSSVGQGARNAHPLSQSQSYTQMRSEPSNIDRYNGGFEYGYEPGYGVS